MYATAEGKIVFGASVGLLYRLIPVGVFVGYRTIEVSQRGELAVLIEKRGTRSHRLVNSKREPGIAGDPVLFFHPGQYIFHELENLFRGMVVLINRLRSPIRNRELRD